MLIQVFVENSIKHGIFHKKDKKGSVSIRISKQNDHIQITVEDDGVGRQRAKELAPERKGKGVIILSNYLDLYKQQFKTEINFYSEDIITIDKVTGTKAIINISLIV